MFPLCSISGFIAIRVNAVESLTDMLLLLKRITCLDALWLSCSVYGIVAKCLYLDYLSRVLDKCLWALFQELEKSVESGVSLWQMMQQLKAGPFILFP